ncbi:MAG: hypothetical protein HC805_03655 [Alkalinema sp. RL_2_19]|nr:hypothetical protein [Alkalinema sp. RL_2_19]
MTKGFQRKTAQQLYGELGIYANEVRQIARTLNLGAEPYSEAAVAKMQAFVNWVKQEKLTVQQGLRQVAQGDFSQAPPSEPVSEPSEPGGLPVHLQELLARSAVRAQAELDTLDRAIYEQVELPAAQAAVDRVLATDRNTEQLDVEAADRTNAGAGLVYWEGWCCRP